MTVLLALVLACARPVPTLPGRDATRWSVGVVAASGDRTLTALYALESSPAPDSGWTLRTLRTEGTWEEQGRVLRFDSERPDAGDPWPLTMQHLVASVPVTVDLDEGGRAERLRDAEAWSRDARTALYGADVPARALAAGESLIDAEGMLADIRRTFPGVPTTGEPWVREERIAGVPARRIETCETERAGAVQTWTCAGTIEGPERGPARLHETTSHTEVVADRRGLVRVETTFSGTLVLMSPDEDGVLDRPIGGRRVVERL